ncbi:macro domain-containing protein [Halorussus halobius]|uniref:macro domain-containing protein n=1 Tax=Halorussus halobius TaxID=1710537 RepID=UPI0010923458|nr:macro domain-containing protein [Halorussus halobius]
MTNEIPDDYPHFCSICGDTFNGIPHATYANPVCDDCDSRAVSEPGVPARQGDNPVFIDGIRCFRRYKMGGWLSQRDALGCDDYDEFYDTHYDDSGPIHTFNQPDPPQEDREIRQLSEVQGSSEDEVTARVIENDILEESADALICGITTNPSLDGGVAGAVCDASEHSLRQFVRAKAPLQLGDVAVTGGFDLPYSYIVFVAATPTEDGEGATEESVQRSVKNGLHQVADLRLPSVVLPLIGAGAGGLDAQTASSAISAGIRSSRVSPPICVRLVTRNASNRRAMESTLSDSGSDVIDQEFSDPLEGKLSAHLERVDKSGSPSDWEIYQWVTFDPFSGEITEFDGRDNSQQTLEDYGPPETAVEQMKEAESKFVEDRTLPEQWFAWFKSFNSQMGGCRAAMDHPKLDRYLYNREHSLIGVLRGLEHRDSVYSDILEIALDTEENETTAKLRYRVSGDSIEAADDFTDSCLQTALRVVEYTVETMSHLDFDHPMSDTMEVTEIDRVEVIAHVFSQVGFELDIPLDLAEDVVYRNPNKNTLRATAMVCKNYLE